MSFENKVGKAFQLRVRGVESAGLQNCSKRSPYNSTALPKQSRLSLRLSFVLLADKFDVILSVFWAPELKIRPIIRKESVCALVYGVDIGGGVHGGEGGPGSPGEGLRTVLLLRRA